MVHGRLRREVRLFAHVGLAILARIEDVRYDVFTRRPALRRTDMLRLIAREVWAR
jgi:hypothetical protein